MQQNKTEELGVLFDEMKEIQKVIIQSSNVIAVTTDPGLKQIYMEDVKPFIENHKKLTLKLKTLFEEHFKHEKITGVINLSYRKFYRYIVENEKNDYKR